MMRKQCIDFSSASFWLHDRFFLHDTVAIGTCKPDFVDNKEFELLVDGHKYKFFPVQNYDSQKEKLVDTDYCVVFDTSKLTQDVDLNVYCGPTGIFIGKDACQVKNWSKKLGIRSISVRRFLY